MTEMTNAQLTAEVDALAEQVRQMENLLALFMVNGLADAFDGSGNQTYGGGTHRIGPSGIEIRANTPGQSPVGIWYVPTFQAKQPGSNTNYAAVRGNGNSGGNIIELVAVRANGDYAGVYPYSDNANNLVKLYTVKGGAPSVDLGVTSDIPLPYAFVENGPFLLDNRASDYASGLFDGAQWYRYDLFRPRIRSNGITGNLGIEIQSATAPAVANNGTIATAGVSAARVAPAGAVTGVILAVGTTGGQVCTVINESVAANTVTFAAAGTSNVADGAASVIAGLTARRFVWDSVTALWYPTK